jgi:hypothetical protein
MRFVDRAERLHAAQTNSKPGIGRAPRFL